MFKPLRLNGITSTNRMGHIAFATTLVASTVCMAQSHGSYGQTTELEPLEWANQEKGILENHIQLTSSKDFFRAGEQYFSPDMKWLIFQGVVNPAEGEEPAEHYTMYVAPIEYDSSNRISGLGAPIQVSPDGSANTCGFFHPTIPGRIILGSTLTPPKPIHSPGYQRGSSRYVWAFPADMDIVTGDVPQIATGEDKGPIQLSRLTNAEGYDAECAFSPEGRFVVYGALLPDERGVDLYVYDTKTERTQVLVTAPGYDGGPFFSPDGSRICYRSDRDSSNLLQVFVADLEFDTDGGITGIGNEYQLTNNKHVNWGPYWHPDGKQLVYATSEVGHHNYEVFIADADPGTLDGNQMPVRYGTNKRRVTFANGFDGLPVFSPDGQYMIWVSQRVEDPKSKGASQIWIADFVMPLELDRSASGDYDPSKHSRDAKSEDNDKH